MRLKQAFMAAIFAVSSLCAAKDADAQKKIPYGNYIDLTPYDAEMTKAGFWIVGLDTARHDDNTPQKSLNGNFIFVSTYMKQDSANTRILVNDAFEEDTARKPISRAHLIFRDFRIYDADDSLRHHSVFVRASMTDLDFIRRSILFDSTGKFAAVSSIELPYALKKTFDAFVKDPLGEAKRANDADLAALRAKKKGLTGSPFKP